jgi:hypothetical protein
MAKRTIEQCPQITVSAILEHVRAQVLERYTAADPGTIKKYVKAVLPSGRVTVEVNGVQQVLELTTTACNFGGERYWLLCPHCRRRCAALYLPPRASRLACRYCYDLSYRSQQERPADLAKLLLPLLERVSLFGLDRLDLDASYKNGE